MENTKKFCTECGHQTEKEAKFCTQCGYNFTTGNQSASTMASSVQENPRKKLNWKRATLGLVLAGTLYFAYTFLYGGVAIAGEYENEDTIYDSYYHETVDISRNGKVTFKEEDFEDSYTTEFSFYIDYNNAQRAYVVDQEKGIEMKLTFPTSYLFYEEVSPAEINMLIHTYGFKQSTNGNMTVISGEFDIAQARMYDLSFDDFYIYEQGNNLILNGSDLLIKK